MVSNESFKYESSSWVCTARLCNVFYKLFFEIKEKILNIAIESAVFQMKSGHEIGKEFS